MRKVSSRTRRRAQEDLFDALRSQKIQYVRKVDKDARAEGGSGFSLLPSAMVLVAECNQSCCLPHLFSLLKASYNVPIMYVIGTTRCQRPLMRPIVAECNQRCVVAIGIDVVA